MRISQTHHEFSASESLLGVITVALGNDDAASALRVCEERLAVAPDDADVYRYLGQIHARQGTLDAAREAAQRATELGLDDPRAFFQET